MFQTTNQKIHLSFHSTGSFYRDFPLLRFESEILEGDDSAQIQRRAESTLYTSSRSDPLVNQDNCGKWPFPYAPRMEYLLTFAL